MPKVAKTLTTKAVDQLKKPGVHAVGGTAGLYLQVGDPPSPARSWLLRTVVPNGRRRTLGLGPYPEVTLAEARELARKERAAVREGVDPVERKRAERAAARTVKRRQLIFKNAAERYIEANAPDWKNVKTEWQWRHSLRLYVLPKIGDLEVADVGTAEVLQVLEPIWRAKNETATRVRNRIELIVAWADHRAERDRLNPARWKGHLDKSLPAPGKVQKVKPHDALAVGEVGAFMARLRSTFTLSARCLELMILCANRPGEARGARWNEIDFAAKVWTIPAERMKGTLTGSTEHRIPLSDPAVALLESMPRVDASELVFPSKGDRPMSDATLGKLLRTMGVKAVPHGFRSTFRTWAAEQTAYPREVCEQALAHTVGNAVENAYQRGDLLDKRRRLMQDWSQFLCVADPTGAGGNVVTLRTGTAA